MLNHIQGRSVDLSATQEITRDTGSLLTSKIWLPKLLYDLLPGFYLVSGVLALFATLYISAWFWVLPHYLIFSAACVHLAFVIYRRRRRPRNPQ